MEFQTNKAKWHADSEGTWLSLHLQDRATAIKAAQQVQGKLFNVEIKVHRKRRSLDANAYMWVLLDKLSAVLRVPKVELYLNYVRDIGGNCETFTVHHEAVKMLCDGWSHSGIGWVSEVQPSAYVGFSSVTLYKGSSEYDAAQMARLLELVVHDCKAQGIETMTPDELCRLAGLRER